MKSKSNKIRKNIMVDPNLVKRAKNILNADSDSQAIEIALRNSLEDRKTNEEVWKATEKFINSMKGKEFKPLFS